MNEKLTSRTAFTRSDLTSSQSGDTRLSCPKCGFVQPAAATCQACGIIFERIKVHEQQQPTDPATARDATPARQILTLRQLLLAPRPRGNLALAGTAGLWVLMFGYGIHLLFAGVAGNSAGESILHLVNLPFHEAGHLLF